jgi:hypothetical protein
MTAQTRRYIKLFDDVDYCESRCQKLHRTRGNE